MAGYDYSRDALYFVTSCVHDRIHAFGFVKNGKMILNDYGQIAKQQWYWLKQQYPYVILHSFVVMPNHIHGIIEINRSVVPAGTGRDAVGTGRDLSLQRYKIKSLSELMGAYKTTVSKKIHMSGNPDFSWQRSFHDHIIRDHGEYKRISAYIRDNPQQWREDQFYE